MVVLADRLPEHVVGVLGSVAGIEFVDAAHLYPLNQKRPGISTEARATLGLKDGGDVLWLIEAFGHKLLSGDYQGG